MAIPSNEGIIDKLRGIVAFKYFSDDALKAILTKATVLSFKEGDVIIEEGDKSPDFYAVVEGLVNVTVREGDKEVYISAIGKGDVFGEAGIFLNVQRTANVASAVETVILRIHRNDLLAFIRQRPSDGIKFLMIIIYSLLKKLRDANQELAFERKADFVQEDVDSMVREIMDEQ